MNYDVLIGGDEGGHNKGVTQGHSKIINKTQLVHKLKWQFYGQESKDAFYLKWCGNLIIKQTIDICL